MDFSQFFTPESQLRDGSGIAMYGLEHLTWLAAMFLIGWLICRHYKKLSYDAQEKRLRFLSALMIVQEIVKDILFIAIGAFTLENLPFHLCGISVFICAFAAFGHKKLAYQMTYAVTFPGALAALLFPNWLQYPVLHFSSINSFTMHGYMILFTALAILGHRYRPDYHWVPKCALTLGCLALPLYFINKWWGTNFFFINTPSPGSPLVIFAQLLGNPGYIVGEACLLFLIWFLMYLPWALSAKKKQV